MSVSVAGVGYLAGVSTFEHLLCAQEVCDTLVAMGPEPFTKATPCGERQRKEGFPV